jgi:hypothetical protein
MNNYLVSLLNHYIDIFSCIWIVNIYLGVKKDSQMHGKNTFIFASLNWERRCVPIKNRQWPLLINLLIRNYFIAIPIQEALICRWVVYSICSAVHLDTYFGEVSPCNEHTFRSLYPWITSFRWQFVHFIIRMFSPSD